MTWCRKFHESRTEPNHRCFQVRPEIRIRVEEKPVLFPSLVRPRFAIAHSLFLCVCLLCFFGVVDHLVASVQAKFIGFKWVSGAQNVCVLFLFSSAAFYFFLVLGLHWRIPWVAFHALVPDPLLPELIRICMIYIGNLLEPGILNVIKKRRDFTQVRPHVGTSTSLHVMAAYPWNSWACMFAWHGCMCGCWNSVLLSSLSVFGDC